MTERLSSPLDSRFDLIPPNAARRVAEVLHTGSLKYGEFTWRQLSKDEHMAHLLSHAFSWLEGRKVDEDDLANLACRAMFLLSLDLEDRAPTLDVPVVEVADVQWSNGGKVPRAQRHI